MPNSSHRRLSAIMFSDIVGYTSLMGKDEQKAFDFLKKNRRVHYRLIRKYRGRMLKEMGDGTLASFPSNIDAIQCALSIQMASTELNIPLRIGIHQGDVIFEKKDVLGDGVNIASRIQGVAETHGIAISETVFNDIRNKEGLEIELLGEKELKGVQSPVRVYKVSCQDVSMLDFSVDTGELIRPLSHSRIPIIIGVILIAIIAWLGNKYLLKVAPDLEKTMLILPFDNYTGSDTLDYFVAGMHSSLIGDVGKISAMRIISKTTARAYKSIEKSIPEMATELDVNYVVEPSVMCMGDSICIQVRLMTAYPEEKQLWVKDYYAEKSQILNLYNKVTKEISEEINVALTPKEEILLADTRSVDVKAYDAYMKGQFYMDQINDHSLKTAAEYFKIAINIDPTWAAPYVGLAEVGGYQSQMGYVAPELVMPGVYENMNKALELDPNSARSYHMKAVMATWGEWNWEKGEEAFQKALTLDTNNALTHVFYGHLMISLHRTQAALKHADLAVKLDPLRPFVLGLSAVVKIDAGDYPAAIALSERALKIDPFHFFANGAAEMAYYQNGDYANSFEILSKIFAGLFYSEDETITMAGKVSNREEYMLALSEMLEKVEKNAAEGGYVLPWDIGKMYLRMNDTDKAMTWFETGFQIHDPNMPYLSTRIEDLDKLKGNQAYTDLLNKLKLPVR